VKAQHILAGSTLALLSTTALAQQAAPADTGEQQRGLLEEVVVTAEKREQNVQSVPISISAFSERMLQDYNVASTNELMNFVPSLNISRVNVASIPFIRGIGNFTGTPGNEAAVVTYVDDVYYPSPMGSTFQYNSNERVEVLKGPQGTLFGRNASGGVINIITKDPAATPQLDFDAGYANYQTFSGSFYGSTPITDNLGANLAVNYQKQDAAWGHNLVDGSDVYYTRNISARTKVVYKTDEWKVRFAADYNKTRDDATPLLAIIPGTTTIAGYQHAGGFYDVAIDTPSSGNQTQYGASLRVDRNFDWGTLTSISAGRHSDGDALSDLDASPANLITYRNQPTQQTWTQEFQVASPAASKVKWLGGLFLYWDDAALAPQTQSQPSFTTFPQNIRILFANQKTRSYAPFGQVTFPLLSDATRLTLGARYTSDRRELEAYRQETIFGDVTTRGGGFSSTWPKVTYRFSLDHDFADHLMGYVSYNRGFKSGNYNLSSPTAAPVAPEVVDAYELGMKTDLFDGRARLNWSAYYYKISDKQVQQRLTVGNLQTNAAAVKHKGLDVDLTVVPTDRLTIVAAAAFLDAKFSHFPNSTFYFPCVTPATSPQCQSPVASVNGGGYYLTVGDSTDLYTQYAEKAVATLSTKYEVPIARGDLKLIGSVAYHDGFFFDVQNILDQPSYYLLDASAVWTAPDGKYDVTLWGKNLLNEEYFGQKQLTTMGANYAVQPPRTYGITFGFHFD
jgi:iron complex outermembrane receptor protein